MDEPQSSRWIGLAAATDLDAVDTDLQIAAVAVLPSQIVGVFGSVDSHLRERARVVVDATCPCCPSSKSSGLAAVAVDRLRTAAVGGPAAVEVGLGSAHQEAHLQLRTMPAHLSNKSQSKVLFF